MRVFTCAVVYGTLNAVCRMLGIYTCLRAGTQCHIITCPVRFLRIRMHIYFMCNTMQYIQLDEVRNMTMSVCVCVIVGVFVCGMCMQGLLCWSVGWCTCTARYATEPNTPVISRVYGVLVYPYRLIYGIPHSGKASVVTCGWIQMQPGLWPQTVVRIGLSAVTFQRHSLYTYCHVYIYIYIPQENGIAWE